MLIARKKTRWAIYFDTSVLVLLALAVPLSLFQGHLAKDFRPFFWVVLCALIGAALLSFRFTRRREDRVIVRELWRNTSFTVTPATRISAKYCSDVRSIRPSPKYVFRVVDADGTMADIGTAVLNFDTTSADMGRRLASVLDIPLDDDAPGAGGGHPDGPVVKVETKAESKGLEDRVTGWVRRHWLLSIGGSLALFLTYLHLAGGVEMRTPAQIDMPCAGYGYHARIRFGAFTRIDGDVSGQVNPGNSEISVWDNSRRCWARRIVSVDFGHRLSVDCAWVLASSDCLTGDP
jgi:hypothetical protein